MVKKFFSHCAPRPLQQPQMPDMKQIKHSVCNHIRHFSLLSYLPSAGNPSTQPQIRRLALPIIRSITIIPPTTPHTPNSLFSAALIFKKSYACRPLLKLRHNTQHCADIIELYCVAINPLTDYVPVPITYLYISQITYHLFQPHTFVGQLFLFIFTCNLHQAIRQYL